MTNSYKKYLNLPLSGKALLKTVKDSDDLHSLLFGLNYSYLTVGKTYPKNKPYGISWYYNEGECIIRKTSVPRIFENYCTNNIALKKVFK